MGSTKSSKTHLSGCGKFIKYSIFIVNFILFLGGLAVTGLGIWVLADRPPTSKVLNGGVLVAPSAILLAFGCILVFVTFLGCCGAILENRCLLLAFFVSILLITILIVVGVALLAKNKDKVLDSLKSNLENTLDQYYIKEDIKQAWDYIQKNFQCCGVTSSRDWFWRVPDSCKCTLAPECDQEDYYITLYWRKGCVRRIPEIIDKVSKPLLAVAITVIVILFLSMIFTCSLVLMLRKK